MKRILPLLFLFLFPLAVQGEGAVTPSPLKGEGWDGGEAEVKHFKTLARTISFPYHYEGLWPLLGNLNEEHYTIHYDARHYPLEIRHFGRDEKLENNADGWAVFKIEYDEKGDLREAAFYDSRDKPAFNKEVGFSREMRQYNDKGVEQRFYDPFGNHLGLKPEKHLRNKRSRPTLAEPRLPVLEKTTVQK